MKCDIRSLCETPSAKDGGRRRTRLPWGAVLVVCAFLLQPPAIRADDAEAVSPRESPIKLFDGKSLKGFYTWLQDSQYEDPRGVFRVVNGVLRVSGDGMGAVVTKKRYRDYHLILEYKWGEHTWRERRDSARDSGLLIHSNGADGGYNGIWMPALEVQIIEGGVGDFILVSGVDRDGCTLRMSLTCEARPIGIDEAQWQKGAPRMTFSSPACPRINWYARDPNWKDVRGFRGAEDPDSPADQWTRLDVVCDGDRVQTYVNGILVNEAFDVTPHAGRLQLQSELAELFVRRWELWPLDRGPRPQGAEP